MRKGIGLLFAAVGLWGVNACSEGAATPSPSAPPDEQVLTSGDPLEVANSNRLLCADCMPHPAGGETGDFVAVIDDAGCRVSITELGRDGQHAGLNAADAVQALERSVSVPAHFRPTRSVAPWADAGAVSGYTETLSVDLNVEVTKVAAVELLDVQGVPNDSCGRKYLAVETRVSVGTSDGSLSGSFDHVMGLVYSTSDVALEGSADAASFVGSLDIGAGHEPPVEQLVADLSLNLSPNSSRGALELSVVTRLGTFGAINLEWPVDACPPEVSPASAAEYEPAFQQAKLALQNQYPMTAYWAAPDAFRSDALPDAPIPPGLETSVTLALNGAVNGACRTGSQYFMLTTTLQLSTGDGRILGTLPGTLDVSVGADGTPSYHAFSAVEVFRAAELETQFGIRGVDLLGSECGMFFFRARSNAGLGEISGTLEILTRPCDDTDLEPSRLGDFISWCSGPCEFPETPNYRR